MPSTDRSQFYPHPARLILILSLAPTVGLGIGRFAYALVLPDMRDTLLWSYSAAGFMNTINAAGYLVKPRPLEIYSRRTNADKLSQTLYDHGLGGPDLEKAAQNRA